MIKPLPNFLKLFLLLILLGGSFTARSQCNPMPTVVATPALQTMCSGASITPIVLSGNIPNTTFNWTRNNTATVTGIAASGSGNISGTLTNTTTAPVPVTFTITPQTTQLISETFNTVLPAGWAQQNLSSPIGTQPTWFAGTAFPPYSPTGFIAANYNSTTVNNIVSNWLFTPVITMKNGDQLSFYTRTSGPAQFPDRLQVRISTNGSSLNAGTNNTSVGDFTTLLMDINPTYAVNGYLNTWTQFTVTMMGLPASGVTGRIAFRYFAMTGNSPSENSAMIGIDDVVYTAVNGITCTGSATIATVVVNPSPTVTITSDIPPPLLPGQVMTLTANVSPAGGTYVWYKDGVVIVGATGNTLAGITVNDLGNYTVMYTAPNGCSSVSAGFNVFAKQANGLFIHPNPNNGHFRVTFFNVANEEVTAVVYDPGGRIVTQRKTMTGTASYAKVEMELPPGYIIGTYIVEVRNSKGMRIGSSIVSIAK